MTEITANLTVAWLDAFARLQSPKTLLDEIEGAAHRAGTKQVLSDVIENALRAGGTKPLMERNQTASSVAQDPTPGASGQAIDLLV